MADDFILLFDEILSDDYASSEPQSRLLCQPQVVSKLELFRTGVLEHALRQSPYNFDIQLALAKIYDSHGLCIQFKQAWNGLGIKGV